ncbi:BACON domain-containing protein [Pararhodonellum marinum]|uniref:BACON domain-containing protein n=1 Tax=Pararhodonellum marinum TaxID=2755358 RepID=UPI00188F8F1D|nr:BACON domain-containing protein [Pararhodonellum marinum]
MRRANHQILQVSFHSFDFSPEGESTSLEITSTGSWSFEHSTDWLEITPKQGQGNATVTLKSLPNLSGNDRQITVQLRLGEISQQIQLSQKKWVDESYIDPDPT